MPPEIETEKRRFRRALLNASVNLRPATAEETDAATITGAIKDVGLGGIYCTVASPSSLKLGDEVHCSVSIEPGQRRIFPFSRVCSKGSVIRMDPHASQPKVGLAVAFSADVTALGTIGG